MSLFAQINKILSNILTSLQFCYNRNTPVEGRPRQKHMLTTQTTALDTQINTLESGSLITRVFTDHTGRSFRLTFFVTIVNGEVKGRLVSAQPISKNKNLASQDSVLCLPVAYPVTVTETPFIPAFTPFVSPFSELFFFTSQPTRAPSYK